MAEGVSTEEIVGAVRSIVTVLAVAVSGGPVCELLFATVFGMRDSATVPALQPVNWT